MTAHESSNQPFTAPYDYLPEYRELYLAHDASVLRPAVAFCADVADVRPRQVMGQMFTSLFAETLHICMNFTKVAYPNLADQHRPMMQGMEQYFMPTNEEVEYGITLQSLSGWLAASGEVIYAAEPAIDINRCDLRNSLQCLIPPGVVVPHGKITSDERQAALVRCGDPDEIRESAIALGEEVKLHILLSEAATGMLVLMHVAAYDSKLSTVLDHCHNEMINVIGKGHYMTADARSKRTQKILRSIQNSLLDMPEQTKGLITIDTEAYSRGVEMMGASLDFLAQANQRATEIAEGRKAKSRREADRDTEAKARQVLEAYQAHIDLYSPQSGKQLRKSPYWGLYQALTGHGPCDLRFEGVNSEQAAKFVSGIRRVNALLEANQDEEACLHQLTSDLDQETILRAAIEALQQNLSLQPIKRNAMDYLDELFKDLAESWDSLLPLVERCVSDIDRKRLENIGLIVCLAAEHTIKQQD